MEMVRIPAHEGSVDGTEIDKLATGVRVRQAQVKEGIAALFSCCSSMQELEDRGVDGGWVSQDRSFQPKSER